MRLLFVAWLVAIAAVRLAAHPSYLTAAVAKVGADGSFNVSLRFDALAFALNDTSERVADPPMNMLLDGPQADLEQHMTVARRHFVRDFQVLANGRPLAISDSQVHFPTAKDVLAWKASGVQPRLPVLLTVDATGQLPAGTQNLAFRFPEIIGTVVLTVERPGEESFAEPVESGAFSTPLAVAVVTPASANAPPIHAAPIVPQSFISVVAVFVILGFEHILPRGLDHVLFVLGLFLLAGRLSSLLWQITAFTIAHSVTLGLSLYGMIKLPAQVVEPLIALSIVLIAIDNLRGSRLHWWRVAIVFGFGLIHGLGFAGALLAIELSRSQFLRALIGFNLGVELGQLAVIALAFLAVGWLRERAYYRRMIVIPASTGIALIALAWTVRRLTGYF